MNSKLVCTTQSIDKSNQLEKSQTHMVFFMLTLRRRSMLQFIAFLCCFFALLLSEAFSFINGTYIDTSMLTALRINGSNSLFIQKPIHVQVVNNYSLLFVAYDRVDSVYSNNRLTSSESPGLGSTTFYYLLLFVFCSINSPKFLYFFY